MTAGAGPRAEGRLIVGFLILPFAAALLAVVVFLVLFAIGAGAADGGQVSDPIREAASLAVRVAIVALAVITFGGVPAVAWLYGRARLSLGSVLVLGALLGNAPFAILSIGFIIAQAANGTLSTDIGRHWHGAAGVARSVAIGLFVGVGSAAIFWRIALAGSASTADGRSNRSADPP